MKSRFYPEDEKVPAKCRLCGEIRILRVSHMIPKFVGKWLKDTSVTKLLRRPVEINRRVQDIAKEYAFCDACEISFSLHETTFANEIFYPYVRNELDSLGVARGNIKSFDYEDWLLKFIISVQWRCLASYGASEELLGASQLNAIQDEGLSWSKFLRGQSKTTGQSEHHIIFLQNMIGCHGQACRPFPGNINRYLLRSVDYTPIVARNTLGVYTKLGPIVIYTPILPRKLRYSETRVKMRGKLNLQQSYRNAELNEFIYYTRPAEVASMGSPSKSELLKIKNSYEKNIERFDESLSKAAGLSDRIMGVGAGRSEGII